MTKTRIAMRSLVASAAIVAIATTGATASSAAAPAAHRAGHKIAFVISGPSVIVHGAFVDGGKDQAHNAYDVFKLAKGSMRIDHPGKDSKFRPHVDRKTCYATFKITGKWSIGHATGAYKGTTGKGRFVANGTAILKRTSSGGCDMKKQPKIEIFTVSGHGRVK